MYKQCLRGHIPSSSNYFESQNVVKMALSVIKQRYIIKLVGFYCYVINITSKTFLEVTFCFND